MVAIRRLQLASIVIASLCCLPGWAAAQDLEIVKARLRALWSNEERHAATPGRAGSDAGREALDALIATAESTNPRHAAAAVVTLAEALETSGNPFGVAANSTMAVSLYEHAASMGSPSAQFALAGLHLAGLFGVRRDVPRAVTLLYFAAASGSMEAQVALGLMHSQGKHTPKSCAAALTYLMPAGVRAAAEYWPNKPVIPPEHFRLDDEAWEDPSSVKDTLRGRVQFIRNSASKSDADAQLSLARLVYAGVAGEQRDIQAALRLWEEAALQEAAPAMAALGHVHAEGLLDAVEGLSRRDEALLGRPTGPDEDSGTRPSPAPPAAGGAQSEPSLLREAEAEAESLLEAAVEENHGGAATTLAIMLLRRHGLLPRPNTTALLVATDTPSEFSRAATLSRRALHLEHADPDADKSAVPSLPDASAQSPITRYHDPLAVASPESLDPRAAPARSAGGGSGGASSGGQQTRIHSSPALRKDVGRAIGLLRVGVEQSVPQALYVAALLRLQGLPKWLSTSTGLSRDFGKARSQLAAAARKGFLPAFLALARLDAHGIGADRSCARAVSHLATLTRLGRAQNDLQVGQRRLEASDATGAVFAWTRAASLGMDVASWNLGVIADKLLAEEHAQTVVEQWNTATRAEDPGSDAAPGQTGEAEASGSFSRVFRAVDASLRLAARQLFQLGTGSSSSLVGPTAAYSVRASARATTQAQAQAPQTAAANKAGSKPGMWQRVIAGRARARQAMMPAETTENADDGAAAPPDDAGNEAEVNADGSVAMKDTQEQEDGASTGGESHPTSLHQALLAVSRSDRARQLPLYMATDATARTMTAGELLPDTARSPSSLVGALQTLARDMFDAAAAGGGDTDAMLMLGEYTRRGRGGQPGRPEAAIPHLREAAERRDARALWTLAYMHEMGEGLPLDWHLAKRLYDDAQGASPEAAGPAWFGRTRLWLKTRLLAVLPPDALFALRPVTDHVLGPMPVGAAFGVEAQESSTAPVSAWEPMEGDSEPAAADAHSTEQEEAEEEEDEGEGEEGGTGDERAGASAAEAALAAIRARRNRKSTGGALRALSTHSMLRAMGMPSALAELGDTLSGGDPEIAVILALGVLMVFLLVLQFCRARCR